MISIQAVRWIDRVVFFVSMFAILLLTRPDNLLLLVIIVSMVIVREVAAWRGFRDGREE